MFHIHIKTHYFTPKLYFYTDFIRIFLHNFIQNSLYRVWKTLQI